MIGYLTLCYHAVQPGRWALPADMTGLEAQANMIVRAERMANMYVSGP